MNKLKGPSLPTDRLDQHNHICDLISVEFPVLSLYTDGRRNWIYLWCDRDKRGVNRWLIFPITREALVAYLDKQASMLTLVTGAKTLWILENSDWVYSESSVDKQAKKARRHLYTVTLEQLSEYLPTEDSFFDESLTDDLDLSKDVAPAPFDVPIDGEWFNADFVSLLKRYERLYAFFYAARPRFVKSLEFTLSRLLRSPWMGGFSRYNLFEHLWQKIPGLHTLKVIEASYGSPGEFKFDAIPSIGKSIQDATMLLVKYPATVESAAEKIRKILRLAQLNKADLSTFSDDAIRLDEEQFKTLLDECKLIGNTLHVSEELDTLRIYSPNTVVYSKAVLSFVIQLDRLAEFQRRGMLDFARPAKTIESVASVRSAPDSNNR
jgi:hypothetical protein